MAPDHTQQGRSQCARAARPVRDLAFPSLGKPPEVRLTGQLGTCVEINGVESELRSEELVSAFPIPLGERGLRF